MSLPHIAAYALPELAQLPQARAPWRLDTGRAALLIHDMQNYFLRPFEAGVSPIAPVIANIGSIAAACRARGVPVFYTAQRGNQDRRDRGLQADLWGPGMSTSADHQPIVTQLAPEPVDFVLTKHRYSAFHRSTLEYDLRARGRDQLVICGIYAHIGCLTTAADAFMRDVEPFFVADGIADFSREKHDLAVKYVADVCGVPMMTRDVLATLASDKDDD